MFSHQNRVLFLETELSALYRDRFIDSASLSYSLRGSGQALVSAEIGISLTLWQCDHSVVLRDLADDERRHDNWTEYALLTCSKTETTDMTQSLAHPAKVQCSRCRVSALPTLRVNQPTHCIQCGCN